MFFFIERRERKKATITCTSVSKLKLSKFFFFAFCYFFGCVSLSVCALRILCETFNFFLFQLLLVAFNWIIFMFWIMIDRLRSVLKNLTAYDLVPNRYACVFCILNNTHVCCSYLYFVVVVFLFFLIYLFAGLVFCFYNTQWYIQWWGWWCWYPFTHSGFVYIIYITYSELLFVPIIWTIDCVATFDNIPIYYWPEKRSHKKEKKYDQSK